MNNAFMILKELTTDDESLILSGIASTVAADRMGDIVEPKGARFALPMPLLWQHDAKSPIGMVTAAKVSPTGITITAQLAKDAQSTALKERVAEAWDSIKLGLVRGLSIGFRPLKGEPVDAEKGFGGMRYKEWEWLELSAVTIPANAGAGVTGVKAFTAMPLRLNGGFRLLRVEPERSNARPAGAFSLRK